MNEKYLLVDLFKSASGQNALHFDCMAHYRPQNNVADTMSSITSRGQCLVANVRVNPAKAITQAPKNTFILHQGSVRP